MAQLILLKWKNENGCIQKLNIQQTISSEWEKAGCLLGLSSDVLSSIKRNCTDDVERCCHSVFRYWLEEEIGDDYPVSWGSVCTLLEDMDYVDTSSILWNIVQ